MSKDLTSEDREAVDEARVAFEALVSGAAGDETPATTGTDDERPGREEDDDMAGSTASIPPELQAFFDGLTSKVDDLTKEVKAARKAAPKSDSEKELDQITAVATATVEQAAKLIRKRDKQKAKQEEEDIEKRAREFAEGLTNVHVIGKGKTAKVVGADEVTDDDDVEETGKKGKKKSGKEPKVVLLSATEQALRHELDARTKELKKAQKKDKKDKKGKKQRGGIRGWIAGN